MDDEASLRAAVAELGLPCVLKTRTLGYDGHGQAVLRGEEDIVRALPMLAVPCIAEEFMRFDFEASVVTVDDGREAVCFPVGRNIHRDGILDLCVVPADAGEGLRGRMEAESRRFMRECGYRGILAIEYFVKDGEFYFQRDGAPSAQQRPLHHRGLHDQPVPRTGPLPSRACRSNGRASWRPR